MWCGAQVCRWHWPLIPYLLSTLLFSVPLSPEKWLWVGVERSKIEWDHHHRRQSPMNLCSEFKLSCYLAYRNESITTLTSACHPNWRDDRQKRKTYWHRQYNTVTVTLKTISLAASKKRGLLNFPVSVSIEPELWVNQLTQQRQTMIWLLNWGPRVTQPFVLMTAEEKSIFTSNCENLHKRVSIYICSSQPQYFAQRLRI
jgi:hypothetical protein